MSSVKPFSIVQVVDSLDAGGAERVAVDLANELSRLGHISIMCVTRKTGSFQSALLSSVSFLNLKRKSTFDLNGILIFRKFVSENHIDCVHAHGNSSALFCVVSLLGSGVSIVHHDHNSIFKNRKLWIERLFLKRVDSWICVSTPILNWAKEKVKYAHAIVINNPVDEKRFTNTSIDEKIKTDLNNIVIVANYKSYKGQLNLLTAVNHRKDLFMNYKVLCYGGNTESDFFRSACQYKEMKGLDNVELLSSSDRVPDVLANAIIGVLPSETEGLSISLLEYMAAGLPVIVTDVGESGNIVRAAKNGIVVPPKDPLALASAFEYIFENKQEWRVMSSNGLKYVNKNFSLTNFANRIITVYEIIKKR